MIGLLLAACAGAPATRAQAPRDGVTLPRANRPVSSIVSPAWDDEASRDEAGEAERVMALLGVRAGMRIADVGAGTGYYTVRLAKRVGPGGMVYAQDIDAGYLKGLRDRIERARLANVAVIRGTPDDPSLPAGQAEVVLLSHMYHEIARPYDFLWRLWPGLAPGARVAVLDMDRPTQSHGTPPALLECEMQAVGYTRVALHDLAPAAGYLMIFRAPATRMPADAVRACAS